MYNSERFLNQCIESFLRQSIIDQCELILVDDCSPDHSAALARDYEKRFPENIHVIGYEKNRRAGGARNYGLKAAKGRYVLFLDADDWLDDYALEKLYSIAEKEKSDIVDCDYYAVNCQNNKYLEYQTSMENESTGIQNTEKRSKNIVMGGRIFTKLFLKQYLIDNEFFYPENLKFEDNGIGPIMCYKANNIGKVNEPLYYYRLGNSASQTGQVYRKDAVYDRLKSSQYLLETTRRVGAYTECYDAVAYRFTELFYASNLYIYVRGRLVMPLQVLKDMRAEISHSFPNYRRTKYYKKLSVKYRICCTINDFSPIALKAYRQIFGLAYWLYKQIKKCGG